MKVRVCSSSCADLLNTCSIRRARLWSTAVSFIPTEYASSLTLKSHALRDSAGHFLFITPVCKMPYSQLLASACHNCHAGSGQMTGQQDKSSVNKRLLPLSVCSQANRLIFALIYLLCVTLLYIACRWLTPCSVIIFADGFEICPLHKLPPLPVCFSRSALTHISVANWHCQDASWMKWQHMSLSRTRHQSSGIRPDGASEHLTGNFVPASGKPPLIRGVCYNFVFLWRLDELRKIAHGETI